MTFFVTKLFNIFMRQTLTDDFWGLHKKYELRVSFKRWKVPKYYDQDCSVQSPCQK